MSMTPQMKAAQRATQEYAKEHGTSRRIGRTGRLSMNIHPAAYQNAINSEGADVVNDKGYWEDQKRNHPEIAVKFQSDTVGFAGSGGRPKNRFGNVKTRVRFEGPVKVETNFATGLVTRTERGKIISVEPLDA